MLVKPFASIIAKEKELATMSFLGTVEDNNDPQKLGRVRIHAAPYEDMTTDQLPWSCPKAGMSGNSSTNCGMNIPEVGSQVRVFFPNQDTTAPHYEGAEYNETNRSTFFDEDYPNSYGYKDSKGNFIRVNKEKETIELQHSSTSNLKVSPDGSAQISLSNGSSFTFSNYDGFNFNVKGVEVSGNGLGEFSVNAKTSIDFKTTSMNVDANTTTFTGNVHVGGGASGTFWTMGHLVCVQDGIIVSIQGI